MVLAQVLMLVKGRRSVKIALGGQAEAGEKLKGLAHKGRLQVQPAFF